jgi:regulator of extracellular matrix RemA (YlzA/DUF370 family)
MPAPVINIGFHNFVVADKVIAIVSWDSAPMRRLAQDYRKRGRLIDVTQGRRSKSLIFLEDDYAILSAISQVTLARRFVKPDAGLEEENMETGT